jgi:hypothetical protein
MLFEGAGLAMAAKPFGLAMEEEHSVLEEEGSLRFEWAWGCLYRLEEVVGDCLSHQWVDCWLVS